MRTKDFQCPEVVPPVDYLLIQGWLPALHQDPTGPRRILYEIPRSCVEALGIQTDAIPPGGSGLGVWFSADQAQLLRNHRHTVFPGDQSVDSASAASDSRSSS